MLLEIEPRPFSPRASRIGGAGEHRFLSLGARQHEAIVPLCKAGHAVYSILENGIQRGMDSMAFQAWGRGQRRGQSPNGSGVVKRTGRPALLTGRGHYVDDLRLPRTCMRPSSAARRPCPREWNRCGGGPRAYKGVHLVP